MIENRSRYRYVRIGIAAALNIIFALIFLNIGDANRKGYDLYSHFGAIMFAAISAMFGSAQPVVLLFPFERPLFVREYANGTQHSQKSQVPGTCTNKVTVC